ncbi:MAG: PspA/IM30 family protein [Dehalococcoidia bacterium]|nr:PspA/IM30 family protein [Dehalococcoidia bacterium]
MGIIARVTTLIKAQLTHLLDSAEDPRQTLDYSYQKQVEMLQNVKRGVVEVVTSRRRLELQAARLEENVAKLDDQARQAVTAGRDDLARLALTRKQTTLTQIQDLAPQIDDLAREQEKLSDAEARLAAKIEAFRTKKEVIKAQYSAAEASVHIGEAATGISEEMADVGMAIQRAEDKTEQLRARAGAIDELVAAGTLEDYTGGSDQVEQELRRISSTTNVEQELAALKQVMAPKQLKEGE